MSPQDEELQKLIAAIGRAARGGAANPDEAREKLAAMVAALREAGVPEATATEIERIPERIGQVLTAPETAAALDTLSARLDAWMAELDAEPPAGEA